MSGGFSESYTSGPNMSYPLYFLSMPLDIAAIRKQFPYLDRTSGEEAAYLDNAATTQTPKTVIMTMSGFLTRLHGNVHRGQHAETEYSSTAYEAARMAVHTFMGAAHADEIIFTKNATEGINLVAHAWARANLKKGDSIVLSIAEHHANIIPWLQLKEEMGVELLWIDVDETGQLQMNQYEEALAKSPMLVALTGQSNVLGTRFDLPTLITQAKSAGARVLVDAAQLAAHGAIDVQKLGCDFLVFSGHKIYGPTGIGVLYAVRDAQKEMKPFMGGGGMVHEVTREHFTAADSPATFEAGTPPIAEAIGLAAAIEWQKPFSWKDREAHDAALMAVALEELTKIEGLRILGAAHGTVSFVIKGIHPHDLTDILGQRGIALRAGHHCTQPLHTFLKIPASTRLSTGLYTTEEEIRRCVEAIKDVLKLFH